MTSYTKGPWEVVEELDIVGDGLDVATCGTSITEFYETAKANARLIAAAPEMGNELFRALAVIRNPQAFDTEGVAADIERVLQKAGLL